MKQLRYSKVMEGWILADSAQCLSYSKISTYPKLLSSILILLYESHFKTQASAPQLTALFQTLLWKFIVHLLVISLLWLCCIFKYVHGYWIVQSIVQLKVFLCSFYLFNLSSPSAIIMTTSRKSKSICF